MKIGYDCKIISPFQFLAIKLSNKEFGIKTPAEVVAMEKAKFAEMEVQLAEMDKQMRQLKAI